MNVFVDTNIFIDILLNREEFVDASVDIYKLCENRIIQGYIAPITINNIHYICRKAIHQEEILAFLTDISRHFSIAQMDMHTIQKAKDQRLNDFEDALQAAMALQNNCDFIITRNVDDFKNVTSIPVLEPKDFLNFIR